MRASGVALMSAILQSKIAMYSARSLAAGTAPPAQLAEAAALQGYDDCFTMMAIASALIIPGVFLFRIGGREEDATPILPGP